MFALVVAAAVAQTPPRIEGGNEQYRVVITGSERLSAAIGHYTIYTGSEHPVTAFLGRPGELLAMRRDCITCGGSDDLNFAVVRSWDSRTDYVLARNPSFLLVTDPGFQCIATEQLALPLLETVTEWGQAVGVRSLWSVVNASDDLLIEQLLRVQGDDFVGSRVEVTLSVLNRSGVPTRVGLREVWMLRVTSPITPSNPAGLNTLARYYIGERPMDPPTEPFAIHEREWMPPAFRMWQAHAANPTPSSMPFRYSIGGAVSGPPTLLPVPTPPDVLQHVALNTWPGTELPPGGAVDACFEWHVPDPPRAVNQTNQMGMVSYWGAAEHTAIELQPGELISRTQYLVAFLQYPLSVAAGGPYTAPCDGVPTLVSVTGDVALAEPTSEPVVTRWSSADPRVWFVDPSATSTLAAVPGLGAYAVAFTAAVGAYEASADAVVEVVSPPAAPGVPRAPRSCQVPASVTSTMSTVLPAPPRTGRPERRRAPAPDRAPGRSATGWGRGQ